MSVEHSLAQRVAGVSPSSILSLPNDLLHPIMQEAYHTSQPPPRRHSISEIIVNKRIFAAARPVWISHLVISEPQADQQFSALEDDELRCQSLQHLEVKVEDFSHLSDVVLSRQFPKLAKLTIHFPYETKKAPAWAIGKIVSRIGNLRHLEVHLNRNKPSEARESIETTLNFPHLLVLSWFRDNDLWGRIGPTTRIERQAPRDMSASTWARLASFELRPFPFLGSNIDGLLDSLESALNGSSGEVPTIPLRRLSLQLGGDGEVGHTKIDSLRSSAFSRLLRLLPSSAVDRLEFTANSIPAISEDVPLVQSVKALRLKCSFRLQEKDHFRSLSRLLATFPALTHLHLVGRSLFGLGNSPESIATLSDAEILLHRELSSLLLWLRTSDVKVFTYRGGEEDKREVRWIRKGETPDEKFERDCWTL